MTNKHTVIKKGLRSSTKIRSPKKTKSKLSISAKTTAVHEAGGEGLIRSNSLYETLAAEQREHIFEHIRFLEEKVAELEKRALVIEDRLDQIEAFFLDMATEEEEMEEDDSDDEDVDNDEDEEDGNSEPEEDHFGQKFDTSSYFV